MASPLASLLTPSRVRVGLQVATKDELLRTMVALVAPSSAVLDEEALLAAVLEREALISTGVGQGIALPHARTDAVNGTVIAFASMEEPVEYQSLDGEPVRLVLFIAGTSEERRGHVRLLSRASRVFADEPTRKKLAAAKTPAEVLETFEEAEATLA